MPDVTEKKLDVAYDAISKAGITDRDNIKVDGGGIFGIVDESNWTVCKQLPSAGAPLGSKSELFVDRTCETGSKTDGESAAPSDGTSESATPTPTTVPTLTMQNSPEFAAALQADSCDGSLAMFASKHSGEQIEFDGSIVDVAPHGDYKTRFDFLVAPGDAGPQSASGPAFQFADKSVFDMNLEGAGIPDSLAAGQKYQFVATVGDFDADSCLFQLSPVTTKTR